MKVVVFVLISTVLLVSSGCAVIDFLDGKHLTRDYEFRPQYGTGYGGGHSH